MLAGTCPLVLQKVVWHGALRSSMSTYIHFRAFSTYGDGLRTNWRLFVLLLVSLSYTSRYAATSRCGLRDRAYEYALWTTIAISAAFPLERVAHEARIQQPTLRFPLLSSGHHDGVLPACTCASDILSNGTYPNTIPRARIKPDGIPSAVLCPRPNLSA